MIFYRDLEIYRDRDLGLNRYRDRDFGLKRYRDRDLGINIYRDREPWLEILPWSWIVIRDFNVICDLQFIIKSWCSDTRKSYIDDLEFSKFPCKVKILKVASLHRIRWNCAYELLLSFSFQKSMCQHPTPSRVSELLAIQMNGWSPWSGNR